MSVSSSSRDRLRRDRAVGRRSETKILRMRMSRSRGCGCPGALAGLRWEMVAGQFAGGLWGSWLERRAYMVEAFRGT